MNFISKVKSDRLRLLLKQIYRYRLLYLLLLPSLIAIFIFHYIPLYGVQVAFKDYRVSKGIFDSEWVGLKHFIKFFQYPYFERVMWNTFWINIVGLLTFPLPIVFSLMLNEMKNLKLRKVCQMITYAPYFVSTVIVCSMVILFTGTDGLINIVLRQIGIDATTNYIAQPQLFAFIYVISGLWSTLGWNTIIYMASLSGVSTELIEAARIDGANRMQVIWHVNLPHLKPTAITMFILSMGSLLSVGFEKIFLLQNPLNMEKSSVISTYVYQVGLLNDQFSYSTAIGLFNNLVNIIMIVVANYISNKVAKIGLW